MIWIEASVSPFAAIRSSAAGLEDRGRTEVQRLHGGLSLEPESEIPHAHVTQIVLRGEDLAGAGTPVRSEGVKDDLRA